MEIVFDTSWRIGPFKMSAFTKTVDKLRATIEYMKEMGLCPLLFLLVENISQHKKCIFENAALKVHIAKGYIYDVSH